MTERFDDRKSIAMSADVLLRESVVNRPPRYNDLPRLLTLDSQICLMPEGQEQTGIESQSIYEVSADLLSLQDSHAVEFGRALVANHHDELVWGPYCQGNEGSVVINAPLRETEIVTASGLIVLRRDKIVATMHSHPDSHSFSLQDFFADFSNGSKQMFVVKENEVIDMAQVTDETRFLHEDAFRRLLSLWETYLLPNGKLRPELGPAQYTDFLRRISESVLKIGFYSNEFSNSADTLKLREWSR